MYRTGRNLRNSVLYRPSGRTASLGICIERQRHCLKRRHRPQSSLARKGFLLLAAAALLLSGCGKKPEEERNSLVITAAETAGTVTLSAGSGSAGKTADTVNGFRFEVCDEMVYCTGDGVKLRKKPGLDGEVVGHLDKGAYVHRIGKNVKWSRIQRDTKRVYVSADYLSAEPPETDAPETEPPEGDASGEEEAGTVESGKEKTETEIP